MAKEDPRLELTLGGKGAPLVRFSYAHLFKEHVNTNNNKKEYSTTLLIPKTLDDGKTPNPEVAMLKDVIARFTKEMFTDKKKPVPPKFWNPLRDGDKDTNQKGESLGLAAVGHYVLNAKESERKDGTPPQAPKVVGTQRGEDGKLIRLTSGVKSGDYGRSGITLYGYSTGDSGVGAALRTVQLVQEGEALGSEADPDADFGEFEDEADVL